MCQLAAHVGRVNPRPEALIRAGVRSSPPITPPYARDVSERWSGAYGDTVDIDATRHSRDLMRMFPKTDVRRRGAGDRR
jgi:hypothetical protein